MHSPNYDIPTDVDLGTVVSDRVMLFMAAGYLRCGFWSLTYNAVQSAIEGHPTQNAHFLPSYGVPDRQESIRLSSLFVKRQSFMPYGRMQIVLNGLHSSSSEVACLEWQTAHCMAAFGSFRTRSFAFAAWLVCAFRLSGPEDLALCVSTFRNYCEAVLCGHPCFSVVPPLSSLESKSQGLAMAAEQSKAWADCLYSVNRYRLEHIGGIARGGLGTDASGRCPSHNAPCTLWLSPDY